MSFRGFSKTSFAAGPSLSARKSVYDRNWHGDGCYDSVLDFGLLSICWLLRFCSVLWRVADLLPIGISSAFHLQSGQDYVIVGNCLKKIILSVLCHELLKCIEHEKWLSHEFLLRSIVLVVTFLEVAFFNSTLSLVDLFVLCCSMLLTIDVDINYCLLLHL